ncbi:hypothetical protein Bca52824_046985 [Brassica carinata]|uniref:Uncharacterized protein n=1 Tax=Brassica carinata TaxID=52824 RepID=A0A8X7RFI4_BRACI|nr:hypothetical protein Bca52824_046985 [Brassica carinata]
MPDCVVLFDAERKSSVILEAAKLQIPVVAIVDPNVPLEFFEKITYPVPARDSGEVCVFMKMGIEDGGMVKDSAA